MLVCHLSCCCNGHCFLTSGSTAASAALVPCRPTFTQATLDTIVSYWVFFFVMFCRLLFPSFHPFANSSLSIAEMLAGRGLPTVPEEDFFQEVEETAGLPPSSSPPSVSTPTPTTHLEFNSRQTAVHPYDEPQSPQLYSHHDTFIPSRSQHSNPNTNANPILTTLQLRQERSPEKEGFARTTTTSPQIRLESPDQRAPERKKSPPSNHSSYSASESFAVPKVKKK